MKNNELLEALNVLEAEKNIRLPAKIILERMITLP